MPGISTYAVPGQAIVLRELSGHSAVIGRYEKPQEGGGCGCMRPVCAGLEGFAREAILRCGEPCPDTDWVSVDELGYVESGCEPFCGAVRSLFDRKRVLAVLRKQHTPFLDELRARDDAYILDLDEPLLPFGAVIMASGYGRRFGANKLLEKVGGKTLIERALDQTEGIFARRVVVTRYEEIAAICRERDADCVLHNFPERNDTVRIGVEYLQHCFGEQKQPAGYLFCPADQPLLTRETLETLALSASRHGTSDGIFRLAYQGRDGAPVLFGGAYGKELVSLPEKKGGSFLIKRYPARVFRVEASGEWEIADVDTPKELERMRGLAHFEL